LGELINHLLVDVLFSGLLDICLQLLLVDEGEP